MHGKTCSVEGCQRNNRGGKGLCRMHYMRLYKTGEVGEATPRRVCKPMCCSIEGCERDHAAKGLCNMHYDRLRSIGEVGEAAPRQVFGREGCAVVGCESEHFSIGWCKRHDYYARTYPGIDLNTLDERLAAGCVACGSTDKPRVDHHHESGKLREILCDSCNTALGLLKEDVNRLIGLTLYVLRHSESLPVLN